MDAKTQAEATVFGSKCLPLDQQPWSKIPGFDRFSGQAEDVSYYMVAQLHALDGDPLALDCSLQTTADWEREAAAELRQAGYSLLSRPGSRTWWVRKPISLSRAICMTEACELTLEDIKSMAATERNV